MSLLPRPVGGIVGTLLRTTGSRNTRGRIGGGLAVLSLTLIALAFVMTTALVMALARASTARWEREKRSARAPRRPAVAPRTPRTASALRFPVMIVRRAVAGLRGPASLRAPLKAVVDTVATTPKQVVSHVRPLPQLVGNVQSLIGQGLRKAGWRKSRTAAALADDDGTDVPVPLVRKRSPGAREIRRDAMARVPGRRFFRRIPRRPHRRTFGFLQRHDRTASPRILHRDGDDGPVAG
jgi:hypothetical protein